MTAAPVDTTHPPAPVRVLVVDDQVAYRDAVATVVANEGGFELVGSLESAQDIDRVLDDLHPDLVLLDVRMPDGDGAEIAVRLRRHRPRTAILLMSVFSSDEIPPEVFEVGARFVEKEDFDAETLHQMRHEVERNRSVP